MDGRSTLLTMSPRQKERTAFGARLFKARTDAKLTQVELAKAAGISQSTLGELEWIGDGSSATVRLALACGVRPEWLAEGIEPGVVWPFQRIPLERVLTLRPEDLNYIEGQLQAALNGLNSPPPKPQTVRLAGARSVIARRKAG